MLYTELALNIMKSLGLEEKSVAIDSKYKLTYLALISTLIELNDLKPVAAKLKIPSRTFDRYLTLALPEMSNGLGWRNVLLAEINKKYCPACYSIKNYTEFAKDTKTTTGYHSSCKVCDSIKSKNYRASNYVKCIQASRNHYLYNKSYYINRNIKKKLKNKKAIPKWLTAEDLKIIKSIYDNANGMHVDHIIPLNGDLVCGLHVPTNLQYLTPLENLQKSNKFEII